MNLHRVVRTTLLPVILGGSLVLGACTPLSTAEPPDLLGWLETALDLDEAEIEARPVACVGGPNCRSESPGASRQENCELLQTSSKGGFAHQAFQLGRSANCYERTGYPHLAESYRAKQRALHNKHGSVLYPAGYYQASRAKGNLPQGSAQNANRNCAKLLDRVEDVKCKNCRYLVVYQNTCSTPLHLAYCTEKPDATSPARQCHDYSTAEPGEVFVVLGEDEGFLEQMNLQASDRPRDSSVRRRVGQL